MDFKQIGRGILYKITSPKLEEDEQKEMLPLLKGVSMDEMLEALRLAYRKRGYRTRVRTSSGKITSYGQRVYKLHALKLWE